MSVENLFSAGIRGSVENLFSAGIRGSVEHLFSAGIRGSGNSSLPLRNCIYPSLPHVGK